MVQIDKSSLTAGNGQRLTKGLFVEYSYEGKESKPVYTLAREDKEVDGVLYPSLYRLYMECDDITEAVFVSRYMLDARQWEMISSGSLFKEEIQNWRNDLKLKKLGRLVEELELDAVSDSRSSKSSAKFLIERVYGLPKRSGRPSNSPAKTDSKDSQHAVERDYERLFGGAK